MAKKCKKCKVPLEGFMYKLIAAKIFAHKEDCTLSAFSDCRSF